MIYLEDKYEKTGLIFGVIVVVLIVINISSKNGRKKPEEMLSDLEPHRIPLVLKI